jgi:hypothetical protein
MNPVPLQLLDRRWRVSARAIGFRVMRTDAASARYSRSREMNRFRRLLNISSSQASKITGEANIRPRVARVTFSIMAE